MSYVRSLELFCDGDRCRGSLVGGNNASISALRKRARILGWHLVMPGRDICYNCWKAGER